MYHMPFSESITLEPYVSQTSGHVRTYGTAVTIPANIAEVEKLVRDDQGIEKVVSSVVAIPPGTTISNKDRMTLPDGSQPVIVSISKAVDIPRKRVLYIEINVGRVQQGEQSRW